MRRHGPLEVVVVVVGVIFAHALLTSALLPFLGFTQTGNTEAGSARFAAPVKMLFQLIAAIVAFLVARHFEKGNPARPAWLLFASGMGCMFIGQGILAWYQYSGPGVAPFPSPAEFFFVPSYPLIAGSLYVFLQAFRVAGYPVGSRNQNMAIVFGSTAVCAIALIPAFRSVIISDSHILAKVLNVTYTFLDCLLLGLCVLMLRVLRLLRGGTVWRMWEAMLAGFAFLLAADVAFALWSVFTFKALDPILHAFYIVAYGLLAFAVLRQRRIVETK